MIFYRLMKKINVKHNDLSKIKNKKMLQKFSLKRKEMI